MFDDCVPLRGIINYSDVEEGRVEYFQVLFSIFTLRNSADGEFRF